MPTLTLKVETLYAACSTDQGVVSFGQCRDEALNNLNDEIRLHRKAGESATGDGRKRDV